MAELAELRTLMAASIQKLIGAYLDAARVDASLEIRRRSPLAYAPCTGTRIS
jgi:hypothetical protein